MSRTCAVLVFAAAAGAGFGVAKQNTALVAIIFGILLILRWPVAATLGMYAFLIPFDSIAVTGGGSAGTTLAWIAGAAAGAVLLIAGVLWDRLRWPPQMAWWWSAFVAWGIMTSFWSVNLETSYARIPTVLGLLALYLIAVSLRIEERELSAIVELTILGGVCASLFSTYQFLSGTGSIGGRGTITSDVQQADPNILAAALILPLSLSIGEFLAESGKFRKLRMLASAGVITAAIFFTMSRGALVAILVMILVFIYRYRFGWRVLVPAVLLGSVVFFMPDLFMQRVKEAAATGGEGRVYIWIAGLETLKHYFFLGAGLDCFRFAYREYAGFAPIFRGVSRASHNTYLGMSVELGFLGIGLLAMAVRDHLRQLTRVYRLGKLDVKAVAFEAAAWGVLAAGFFVDLLWRKQFWLVWVFVVYACITRCEMSSQALADGHTIPLRTTATVAIEQ